MEEKEEKTAAPKAETKEAKPEKAVKKTAESTQAKKPVKESAQAKKAESAKAEAAPKAEAAKKKKKEKVELKRPKKSEKARKMHALLQKKKKLPTFRGKFGCEKIRHHHIEKFSKWRKVRGIDTKRKKENGATPSAGFGFIAEARHLHPSGYGEMLVARPSQLEGFPKDTAARIASKVGRKKRMEIVRKANELGIHVLNY